MRLSELPLADPVPLLSRRKLLQHCGMGFGMVGLAGMLGQDRLLAATVGDTPPHSRPRAKRVIHIFLNGGLSQVDSFDPKPVLTKNDGKPLPYRHKAHECAPARDPHQKRHSQPSASGRLIRRKRSDLLVPRPGRAARHVVD